MDKNAIVRPLESIRSIQPIRIKQLIQDRCDEMGFDTKYESEMKSFRDSMEGVLEAMIRYVLIHESIAEMVKSNEGLPASVLCRTDSDRLIKTIVNRNQIRFQTLQ